ncbi:VOC family protein (plasmid) [Deinococcus aetherius]|uniref:VOC family protein n=1 Tax=Deinococcus aetherius TaxID=200252 RepID=A0ABM8AJZ1_9DEIO|nr:VOC family protein [Deinococcus aetherius]BDP44135.1 VOC family protein [Deinococcus aetherius]
MAQIQVYLGFTDNCKEAMTFYQRCPGGTLEVQTVGESPVAADLPPEAQERVLHSVLTLGDLTLMSSDLGTDVRPNGAVSLMLGCTSREETETYFQRLSEGGQVTHPLSPSFWGSTFGHLTDRYGFQWMLNYTH